MPPVKPSAMDHALLSVIETELAGYGTEAAELQHTWSEAARMWFVETTPTCAKAAPLSVAFDGDDVITITIGKASAEFFPFKEVQDLVWVGQIARAVFGGRVSWTAHGWDLQLALPNGRKLRMGEGHLPLPWRLRRIHTFSSYSDPSPEV